MDDRLTLANGRWFLQSDIEREWQMENNLSLDRRRLLYVKGRHEHFCVVEDWQAVGLITLDGSEDHRLRGRKLVSENEAARWLMRYIPDISVEDLPELLQKAIDHLRL